METNLLKDFIANYKQYNAGSAARLIKAMLKRSEYLTGTLNISVDVDESKSIKNVLQWVIKNPQPKDMMNEAIDLMISGWERAKFIELVEEMEKN